MASNLIRQESPSNIYLYNIIKSMEGFPSKKILKFCSQGTNENNLGLATNAI